MIPPGQPAPLLEHLFRRQAGRMVAHFARVLGPANLSLAEDAVQEAMVRALQSWPFAGVPENAAAWLFRTARNAAIDALRRNRLHSEKAEALLAALSRPAVSPDPDPDTDEQLRDDELRMIILCCHPALNRDASVALSLKTVGGFSVREIARAFLVEEAAVAQRLVRAKRQIRERALSFEMPHGEELQSRLASVLDVLYFMFNEGYAAHEGENLIRQDLCDEALRFARLVAASSIGTPAANALVALMAFHSARLPARVDEHGDLVRMELQDRSRWDPQLLALGFHHFDRSMAGDELSEYHFQAAIAACHARAPDYRSVDWPTILHLYDGLLTLNPSPVVALNRAVALSRVQGPAAGLAAIESLGNHPKLEDYHLLLSVRGHLLQELGRLESAADCFRAALACPCSEPERRFLRRKLQEVEPRQGYSNHKNCIIRDMDLRPLHDRILVKRLEESEQRSGGIIIPDTAKEKPQQAEVMAVGNGKLLENGERSAPDVKVGDRILFGKYSGSEIKIDGQEYLILKEDEILGVLE